MKNKILVVSPHPDDETIGCGGTILRHKACGDDIFWLIITNAINYKQWNDSLIAKRQLEIENVSNLFGFIKTYKLNFPTTKLDTIPIIEIVSAVSDVMNDIRPDFLYVNNRNDAHTDHKIVFDAVYSCTKNFRFPYIKRILMYEALSETEFAPALNVNAFLPNVFIDITEYFKKKIEIMQVYESEVMQPPFPRSLDIIESLAKYRGSRIGVKYAESFKLIFELIR